MRCCYVALFTIWFVPSFTYGARSGYATKIVCFGETLKLMCNTGSGLEISGATYEMVKKESRYCKHINRSHYGCDKSDLTRRLNNICSGKGKCSLEYGTDDSPDVINCLASMYLRISYRCAPYTLSNPNGISKLKPFTVSGSNPTTVSTGPKIDDSPRLTNMTSTSKEDDSLYFVVLKLFVQFQTAGEYIGDHPRWFVLCLVASFATGIFILILYALCYKGVSKYKRYKRKQDAERERNIEITDPVLPSTSRDSYQPKIVTQYSNTPFSVSSVASDTSLLAHSVSKDGRNHQVISTIRRTHSVDEQTQTNGDDVAPVENTARALSPTEMQELGYLVADLKVYESQIDDCFRNDIPSTSKKTKSVDNDYDNVKDFFFSAEPNSSPYPPKYKTSLLQDKYASPFPVRPGRTGTYSFSDRNKYNLYKKESSHNPSEISYETSDSNASEENLFKESIFLGDAFRLTSMQRNHKLGVRGDGFDYIVGDKKPK